MSNIFYVSRLSENYEISDLESLFTMVGDVKTFTSEVTSMNTRTAVFEMETAQQAVDCIARFNGHTEQGQFLSLSANRPVVHVRPPAPARRRAR